MDAKRPKAGIADIEPVGLVGRYFHIWDAEGSNIAHQGRVVAQIDPTHYLVQFYDWLMGDANAAAAPPAGSASITADRASGSPAWDRPAPRPAPVPLPARMSRSMSREWVRLPRSPIGRGSGTPRTPRKGERDRDRGKRRLPPVCRRRPSKP
jgi:hypothetical protein